MGILTKPPTKNIPGISRRPVGKAQPPARVTKPITPTYTATPKKQGHGLIPKGALTSNKPPAKIGSMGKKGTIKPSDSGAAIKRIISGGLSGIPLAGGLASSAFNELIGSGVPPAHAARMAGLHRRRGKGLTHSEIRGAIKVLRLVKRFAPAGHHTALRLKRARRTY